MFKIGGKAEAGNDGIMSGLIDREQLQAGTALEKFQSIGAGDIDFSGLDSDFDTTKRITLPSGETQQVITPQTGLSDKAKANLGIEEFSLIGKKSPKLTIERSNLSVPELEPS